jgi:hypothetical protein
MNPFDQVCDPALTIEIQLPGISFDRLKKFAKHFGCDAFRTNNSGHYRITTNDAINFYWLGMNLNNSFLNKVEKSSISKYIEV